MNIESAFPSTYIKASDLLGRSARVTIRNVLMETVGQEQKPILYFNGKEKGLVLNRTNANTISTLFGPNTDDWEGAEVELFPAMVDFQGRSVEAVRVRIAPRKPAVARGDTAIAPNARDRAMADANGGGGAAPLDDEIPFEMSWR